MKKILVLVLIGLLSTFFGCKTKIKEPTREEIVKHKIEKIILEGIDDPNSYEFDTIYCVYNYTMENQISKVEDRIKAEIYFCEHYVKEKNTKYCLEIKTNCENFLYGIDSIKKMLSPEILRDTIARCYIFNLRANNAFWGKMKGSMYFLCDNNDEILDYFQVDDRPRISISMILPILTLSNNSISKILKGKWSMFGIYDTYHVNYWYDFKEMINK